MASSARARRLSTPSAKRDARAPLVAHTGNRREVSLAGAVTWELADR